MPLPKRGVYALQGWDTVPHPHIQNTHPQIMGEAEAHANALRKLQASHDEALGSAQQVGTLFCMYIAIHNE